MLASPFNRIFNDFAEAEAAFELLQQTALGLGITSPYDPRLAVTLSARALHLDFGGWLVLGFHPPQRVTMALCNPDLTGFKNLAALKISTFAHQANEPEVANYEFSMETVSPMSAELAQLYQQTLTFIANKFQTWQRSSYWQHHKSEVAEAIFDPSKRARLFSQGLPDAELIYERQFTAFGVAEEEEVYQVNTESEQPLKDNPKNLMNNLTQLFKEFRRNPVERFIVKLRQERAKQLRELLTQPQNITLQIFNKEVWVLEYETLWRTKKRIITIFNSKNLIDEKLIAQLDKALYNGELKLEGNYIWGSGSKTYAPKLKDDTEKIVYIHQALNILNDSTLQPLEKAQQINTIYGFGDNSATGLVMVFHPTEWAMYNEPSKNVMSQLGYEVDNIETFQANISILKTALHAADFIELDWFLYQISQGKYLLPQLSPTTSMPQQSVIKLAEPFSDIFIDRAETEWAFEFLAQTFQLLGIDSPDDPRFSLTLPQNKKGLNLNFGNWLVFRYSRKVKKYKNLMALITSEVDFSEELITGGCFSQANDEPQICLFEIPTDQIRFMDEKLQQAYLTTFQYISQRFKNWKGTPYRSSHYPQIAEAVFDLNKRKYLLDNGLTDDEILESAIEMETMPTNPTYPLDQLLAETHQDRDTVELWLRALERKKQIILYGPPGTGKTFLAQKLAQYLIGGSAGHMELVQFHPAYSYEDFMQGLRPQVNEEGQLTYRLQSGQFMTFCEQARQSPDSPHVMIIDEINRANLAQVFGELMYLLEYRNESIPLAAGGAPFNIPNNVRIIGTMNTADRSIALVDHALRRRFAFIHVPPDMAVLRRYHTERGHHVDDFIKLLERLNHAIADPHYEVGHSFFMTENLANDLADIWQLEIEPYLEELFFNRLDHVKDFRWAKVKEKLGRG